MSAALPTPPSHLPPAARHYIGGRFVEAKSGAVYEVVNPATEEVAAYAARGDAADVERAVRAAADVFADGAWSRARPSQRRKVLLRAADLLVARGDDIVAAQAVEMGMPVGPRKGGPNPAALRSAENFRFFAQEQELIGDRAFNRDDTLLTYTTADAAGVFGLITPWNAPIMLTTWKLAPCLAYGNSAVHKPSEWSPLSVQILGEILDEAGLPAGVYNTVLGYGPEVGIPLVESPDIVGVSFTGSRPTAQDIAARAAASLKRTAFELGGKSAMVVFADADLRRAMSAAAFGIFGNSGQVCVAGSRILVERSVYDTFVQGLIEAAGTWTAGDPLDPVTRLGPLVSSRQYERVGEFLELARLDGKVLCGGGRPAGMEKGYYVEPTVVADVPPSSRLWREEIFGPVAVVEAFDARDHALALANDSEYGLSAYLWTDSHSTAQYVSRRLQAGMIWVNSRFDRDLRQPFGGMKHSGLGREGGERSREFFTESRFVSFALESR